MLHTAPEKHTPKSLILKAGCGRGGGGRKREGTETLTKKQTLIFQPCVTAGEKPVCNVQYLMVPSGL